jgi:AhpD family alkylhydroperoxidase
MTTDPRMELSALAPRQLGAMARLEASIELDGRLRELIKVRASQINGCAFCIDMHWKDARGAGESEERLYMLGAWHESPLYDDRERAALELTEAITRTADGHVPDDAWERASAVFAPEELAQVVLSATTINAWNRLMIASRAEPGHYTPAARVAA